MGFQKFNIDDVCGSLLKYDERYDVLYNNIDSVVVRGRAYGG